MANTNSSSAKLKAPKVERIEELIKLLESANDHETMELELADVIDVLSWTYNYLAGRQQYHKKHALFQKELVKAATKLLGKDEVEELSRQAAVNVGGAK